MTKQIYWKCCECSSIINDENMHCYDDTNIDVPLYSEFCYGCMAYSVEVVLAYA